MGFFSWLAGLFGGKKTSKIPTKVVEFRSRPGRKDATAWDKPFQPSPARPALQEEPKKKDMFELAGDRAAKKKADEQTVQAAAPVQEETEPEPDELALEMEEAPDSTWSSSVGGPSPFGDKAPAAEPEPGPTPKPEDDWSPLDAARKTPQPVQAQEPDKEPATEQPAVAAESVVSAQAQEEPKAEEPEQVYDLGGTSEPAAEAAPPPAAPEAPPAVAAAPEAPAPAAEEEPVEASRLLDKLKVEIAEGSGTVTIERKRIETKALNIGGEAFEIALFVYQNGAKAARVPRAAIEKMTEIAKQNNLKVLPRRQNAAVMAGRFLGVPRIELQTRAEKEEYHLVDFTDLYYEITFDELPKA